MADAADEVHRQLSDPQLDITQTRRAHRDLEERVEEALDALRREAAAQNLLDAEGRERARDAEVRPP